MLYVRWERSSTAIRFLGGQNCCSRNLFCHMKHTDTDSIKTELSFNLIVVFFLFAGVFCLLFYWAFMVLRVILGLFEHLFMEIFSGRTWGKRKKKVFFYFCFVVKKKAWKGNKHFINEIRFLSFFHPLKILHIFVKFESNTKHQVFWNTPSNHKWTGPILALSTQWWSKNGSNSNSGSGSKSNQTKR